MSNRGDNPIRNGIVLGVALSAATHIGIEAFSNYGHTPELAELNMGELYPWVGSDSDYRDAGTRSAGDPFVGDVTVVDSDSTPPREVVESEFSFTGAAYARSFDKDERAGEFDRSSHASLVEVVDQLQQDGWDVRIEVTGQASAEDASLDFYGGITEQSEDNIRLANYRRDVFVDALVENGVDEAIIELKDGKEFNFSDAYASSLAQYANQFGYPTVRDMIDAYNTAPESTPPVINEILDESLDSQRGVSAVIVATRQTPGEEVATESTEEACIFPVVQIYHDTETTHEFLVPLPPYGVGFMLGGLALGALWGAPAAVGRMRADRERDARIRQEILAARLKTPRAGGANSGFVAPAPVDTDEPEPSAEPVAGDNIPPVVPKPPKLPKQDREPRRKWPWVFVPVVIGLGSLSFWACNTVDEEPKSSPAPTDPCEGIDRTEERVVATETVRIKDGRVISRTQTDRN